MSTISHFDMYSERPKKNDASLDYQIHKVMKVWTKNLLNRNAGHTTIKISFNIIVGQRDLYQDMYDSIF